MSLLSGDIAERTLGQSGCRTKANASPNVRAAYERQAWFRRGKRWRAGIEGRISGLKRGQGLKRCRYHGDDGMERWVGWGVISHDLRVIARKMAA